MLSDGPKNINEVEAEALKGKNWFGVKTGLDMVKTVSSATITFGLIIAAFCQLYTSLSITIHPKLFKNWFNKTTGSGDKFDPENWAFEVLGINGKKLGNKSGLIGAPATILEFVSAQFLQSVNNNQQFLKCLADALAVLSSSNLGIRTNQGLVRKDLPGRAENFDRADVDVTELEDLDNIPNVAIRRASLRASASAGLGDDDSDDDEYGNGRDIPAVRNPLLLPGLVTSAKQTQRTLQLWLEGQSTYNQYTNPNFNGTLDSGVSDAGTFVLTETSLDLHCWGENPVVTAKLQLNGQDRFSEREGTYFDLVQPYQHHTRSPDTGINVYSFALRPEEHQPSGTANFSRIDNATMQLVLSNATVEGTNTAKVRVYATNYNVLRIMSGMGGFAFSN